MDETRQQLLALLNRRRDARLDLDEARKLGADPQTISGLADRITTLTTQIHAILNLY